MRAIAAEGQGVMVVLSEPRNAEALLARLRKQPEVRANAALQLEWLAPVMLAMHGYVNPTLLPREAPASTRRSRRRRSRTRPGTATSCSTGSRPTSARSSRAANTSTAA